MHLNRVFLRALGRTGGHFLAKLLGEKEIIFSDPNRRKEKELKFATGKALSAEALVHAVQDVRLPLAGLSVIVERYCKAHNIPDQANVLPTVHHILTR
jgi:transcriptional regulator of met regulon